MQQSQTNDASIFTNSNKDYLPCALCRFPANDGIFCTRCSAERCHDCGAESITDITPNNEPFTSGSGTITCINGCETPGDEYAQQQLRHKILNTNAVERLTYGGPVVEGIIPKDTPVTVHETDPDQETVAEDSIVLVHFTEHAETIHENGLSFPPHDDAPEQTNNRLRFPGTVRENAVYGWPFPLQHLYSDDFQVTYGRTNGYVFLEVPRKELVMSTLGFVECVQSVTGALLDKKYRITPDTYEDLLTFSVDTLLQAVREYDRPCDSDVLHWSIKP